MVFPVFWVCLSLFQQSQIYPEKYEYYNKRSFCGLCVPTWTDEHRDPCLCPWTAAHWELSVSGASVSHDSCQSQEFACNCWCLVFGMFVGGCFFILVWLSALCSSNWCHFLLLRCSSAFKQRDLTMNQVRRLYEKFGVLEPKLSSSGPWVARGAVCWIFHCAIPPACKGVQTEEPVWETDN